MILRKGASSRYHFESVEQMLREFVTQRFRLGVIAGFTYARPQVNDFIADPDRVDGRNLARCRRHHRGGTRILAIAFGLKGLSYA